MEKVIFKNYTENNKQKKRYLRHSPTHFTKFNLKYIIEDMIKWKTKTFRKHKKKLLTWVADEFLNKISKAKFMKK